MAERSGGGKSRREKVEGLKREQRKSVGTPRDKKKSERKNGKRGVTGGNDKGQA